MIGISEEDLKKVGIYVGEEMWKEMKEFTLRKHGTTRKLSSDIREFLEANLPSRILRNGAAKLGVKPVRISSSEIKKGRPEMETGSAEIIREMRAST